MLLHEIFTETYCGILKGQAFSSFGPVNGYNLGLLSESALKTMHCKLFSVVLLSIFWPMLSNSHCH